MVASSNPFRRGSRVWGMFIHGNHDARGKNSSSWWGCLCDVCVRLASIAVGDLIGAFSLGSRI